MENAENEKIDKITGQKESEIPIFKQEMPPYQHIYFVITRLFISERYDDSEIKEVYDPFCEVIGLFSNGIDARKKMDKKILNDGFFPSDIEFGSPERVKVKRILHGIIEEVEYKISQISVEM